MPVTIAALEDQHARALALNDDRAAAECAYALAIRHRDAGNTETARQFARQALEIAHRLPSQTLSDVASDRQAVGDVPLPELFHDGVVAARLADLLTEAGDPDAR
ncbi:hypothetical protein [Longispora albida]|uniref:hypothetical protein n=1 Tax=Longispora albida TaxID=203523 RepID=UPI00036DA78D|nr:hypothetical protein [Longispora albida]